MAGIYHIFLPETHLYLYSNILLGSFYFIPTTLKHSSYHDRASAHSFRCRPPIGAEW